MLRQAHVLVERRGLYLIARHFTSFQRQFFRTTVMTLSPLMPWVELDCSDSGALRNTSQNCRRHSGWYELLFLYRPRSIAQSVITGLNEMLMKAYVSTYKIYTHIAPKSLKLHLIISTYNNAQNMRNNSRLSTTRRLYLQSLSFWYLFHILSKNAISPGTFKAIQLSHF